MRSQRVSWTWLSDWTELNTLWGFLNGSAGKESVCSTGDMGFIPWSGRCHGGGKWKLTLVFLPEKSHGQRSLVGYSLTGWKGWIQLSNWTHILSTTCRSCGLSSLLTQISQIPDKFWILILRSKRNQLLKWIRFYRLPRLGGDQPGWWNCSASNRIGVTQSIMSSA